MNEDTYCEFLLGKIKSLFPKKEVEAFLEANEKLRPTTLGVNSLFKRRKDLMHSLAMRNVECGELDWTDTGIVAFHSPVPLGATPEYLSGEYTIQGANSMLPVLNLEIKAEESCCESDEEESDIPVPAEDKKK